MTTHLERESCPHQDAITVGREGFLFCLDCGGWIREPELPPQPPNAEYLPEDFA